MYLDLVILPDGECIMLDEDELLGAKDLTQEDIDTAYETFEMLKGTYGEENRTHLINFTNFILDKLNTNITLK